MHAGKATPARKRKGTRGNAHELDGVVTEVLDARQDVGGELFVGPDFGLGRRDADYCTPYHTFRQ